MSMIMMSPEITSYANLESIGWIVMGRMVALTRDMSHNCHKMATSD